MYPYNALTGVWSMGWITRNDPLASRDCSLEALEGEDEHSQLLNSIDRQLQAQPSRDSDNADEAELPDDLTHERYYLHMPTLQEAASMFIARHWRDLSEHVDLLPPALRIFPLLCVRLLILPMTYHNDANTCLPS